MLDGPSHPACLSHVQNLVTLMAIFDCRALSVKQCSPPALSDTGVGEGLVCPSSMSCGNREKGYFIEVVLGLVNAIIALLPSSPSSRTGPTRPTTTLSITWHPHAESPSRTGPTLPPMCLRLAPSRPAARPPTPPSRARTVGLPMPRSIVPDGPSRQGLSVLCARPNLPTKASRSLKARPPSPRCHARSAICNSAAIAVSSASGTEAHPKPPSQRRDRGRVQTRRGDRFQQDRGISSMALRHNTLWFSASYDRARSGDSRPSLFPLLALSM